MSDAPDNINIEDDEEIQSDVKKGKFLSPFIIKILTITIAFIVITIWIILLFMALMKCTNTGQRGAAGMPQVDSIKPPPVEHLEYLKIEDPFRQRLIDGKMIQLKLSIGYKARNKKLQQELTQIIPEIRDIIIKHLSHLKSDDFVSENALDELEASLIKQINRIVNRGKVERIFFQEYTLM